MGCSKKNQGVIVDSEAKKRAVFTEITSRTPLKPIFTTQEFKKHQEEEERSRCTTPKSEESRVSSKFHCPPPPRKRKTKPRCYYGGVREFFAAPPDFESLFIRRAEKA